MSIADTNARLLSYLALVEGFLAVLLLCFYKKGSMPLVQFFQRPAGLLSIFALIAIVFSGTLVCREYIRHRNSESRFFKFPVIMNLITLAAILIAGEVLIREFSRSSAQEITVRGISLLPRYNWKRVSAEKMELIRRASPNGEWSESYLVPDRLLGWTVGPSRSGSGGLYLSSEEGLRSPFQGDNYRIRNGKRRIAVVGDSYTFGLEVSHEQSWAHRLELRLGNKFQVLNFGVDGYGIDQAYLRYMRDVKPWRPEMVILSFTEHDLTRTLGVYPFLTFPHWKFPFSKPRLVFKDGRLVPLNVPLQKPEEIFSREKVTDLPYLEYEPGYNPADWEERYYHASYLVRYLISAFPRWPESRNEISESEYRKINVAVLREFAKDVRASGMEPIVAYLPSGGHGGLPSNSKPWVSRNTQSKAVLEIAGIEYSDFTPCLDSIEPAHRYLQFHFTPLANQVVAGCMEKLVRSKIQIATQ